MLEHSCKKHCIAPTWICAMGLVLELWDNFEFFADVPTKAKPWLLAGPKAHVHDHETEGDNRQWGFPVF